MAITAARRIDAIEEAYEYLLAYAAQGAVEEAPQLRDFLIQMDAAIDGIAAAASAAATDLPPAIAAAAAGFIAVLDADAAKALAAVRLVLAMPTIGSQMIDNLNASLHLRAVLTDLFLLDEVLKVTTEKGRGCSPSDG